MWFKKKKSTDEVRKKSLRISLAEWRKDNPGKDAFEWLLEVRCQNDSQREQLKALRDRAAAINREVRVWSSDYVNILEPYPDSQDAPMAPHKTVEVEFDFQVCGIRYDVDCPIELFDGTQQAPWNYLRWKAKQMGLENSNFAGQAFNQFQMDGTLEHWSNLLKNK